LALKLQRGLCNSLFSKAFLPKFAPSLTGSFFAKKNVFRGFSSAGDHHNGNWTEKEAIAEYKKMDEEDIKMFKEFADINKLIEADCENYELCRKKAERDGRLKEFLEYEDEGDTKLIEEFLETGIVPEKEKKDRVIQFLEDQSESINKRLDELEAQAGKEEEDDEKPEETAEDLREFEQKYGPPEAEDGKEEEMQSKDSGFNGVISPTPGVPTSFIDKFFYWFRFPIMAPGDPYPDPWTINYYVRCDEILEAMRIPEEERDQFIEENDFSQGYATLEWCLPSPPPHHTFEECPFMKEAPEDH